jgi:hypothetical protein
MRIVEVRVDYFGAVGFGEKGFFENFPNFSSIDIEGRSDLNIPRFVAPDIKVHQAKRFTFQVLPAIRSVKFNPLDQGTSTISDTHHGNPDWLFFDKGSTFLKITSVFPQENLIIVFPPKCQAIWDKKMNHFS